MFSLVPWLIQRAAMRPLEHWTIGVGDNDNDDQSGEARTRLNRATEKQSRRETRTTVLSWGKYLFFFFASSSSKRRRSTRASYRELRALAADAPLLDFFLVLFFLLLLSLTRRV